MIGLFDGGSKGGMVCGGRDTYFDKDAPTEIGCETMNFFRVFSDLHSWAAEASDNGTPWERLGYLSVFAAPVPKGTFVFMTKENSHGFYGDRISSGAIITADIFPELVKLAAECGFAKNNGHHSTTHGLPQDFGGEIDIRYADGSKISISNNQSPLFSLKTANELAALFERFMQGEKAAFPELSALAEIRFESQRKDGGFTKTKLTISPDGTGINEKQMCFEKPKVFEDSKVVSAETVSAIKENIEKCLMLAWPGLPETGYIYSGDKTLTFVFDDGSELAVKDSYELPQEISRGFFNIELELVTKN